LDKNKITNKVKILLTVTFFFNKNNMLSLRSIFQFVLLAFGFYLSFADDQWLSTDQPQPMCDKELVLKGLNVTTGGPYTYSQSKHHFTGTAWDGSYIDSIH
jgi:hypothetical protein